MDAKFKEILQSRGWLAFDTLIFDNSIEVKVRTTGGLLAFEKTNNVFINMQPNDHTQVTRTRGMVAFDKDPAREILSDFASLSFSDIEHLQRYSLSMFEFKSDMLKEDISGLLVPNPKTLLASPTIMEVEVVSGATTVTEDAIVMGNGNVMLKKFTDEFTAKQTQFKAFLVANFGFAAIDLI